MRKITCVSIEGTNKVFDTASQLSDLTCSPVLSYSSKVPASESPRHYVDRVDSKLIVVNGMITRYVLDLANGVADHQRMFRDFAELQKYIGQAEIKMRRMGGEMFTALLLPLRPATELDRLFESCACLATYVTRTDEGVSKTAIHIQRRL